MNKKKVAVAVLFCLIVLGAFVALTNASVSLNLPATEVQLTVKDGTASYFVSTLSGVPAGFSVHNGVYPCWCVDRSTNMERNVSHDILLFSSLKPPEELEDKDWNAINYILNHKQGSMLDVQNAIWHFSDDLAPVSAASMAMVEAAQNNPDTIIGPILAVICMPQDYPRAQISIIEVRYIPGPSPGFWKHNLNVANGAPGSYSSPYDGAPHVTLSDMQALTTAAGYSSFADALADFNAKGPGSDVIRLAAANAFNAAAGFLPYTED
ncbi:MAG TPA: hypothetical protein VK209_03470 [Candidatus Sulfotelmatobacter sp.]|jgi:hypothetical protein|nr:hypothetical protein [Candidatus Sulfotelmatobacter sp.]